jgi:DUF4097 and DUF4098 domain-containing protein YvlB
VNALKVVSVSGDISLQNEKLHNLSMSTTSGNIELQAVGADTNVLNSVSGDILWNGEISSATVTTVSGDVTINPTSPLTGKINAQSTSGQVSIPLQIPAGPNNIDMSSVSGSILVSK